MMYFRPDLGVVTRNATTRSLDPVVGDLPAYSDVTHLRAAPFRAEDVKGDGLTLEGLAAVFNSETVIDSWWEGRFRESIRKGAFARTIREDRQIIQFDHGMNFTEPGEKPIGQIEKLEETSEGLFIRARLRSTWDVQPVRDAIADGSVSGMSIAFRVLGEQITEGKDDELDLREITDIKLFEAGPVTWPAYTDTTVEVKNQNPVLEQPSSNLGADGSPEGTGVRSTKVARTRLALARLNMKD